MTAGDPSQARRGRTRDRPHRTRQTLNDAVEISSTIIGPVPKPVTALCEPGWDIGGVVAKVGKGWRLIGVWNVSP
jgi:hypothetical protein